MPVDKPKYWQTRWLEAWQKRNIAAWKRSKARCQNHTPVSKEEKSENYDLSKFVAWLGSNTTPLGLYLKRKFEQRNPCSKEQLKKKVSVKRGEARLQKTLLSCVCEAEAVIWNKGGDAKYWQKTWISEMRAVLNLLHWLWAECLLFAIRTQSGYNTGDWRLNQISLESIWTLPRALYPSWAMRPFVSRWEFFIMCSKQNFIESSPAVSEF